MEKPNFYGKAEHYWDKIPATIDGMLGGFAHISSTDINGSHKFLHPFLCEGSDTGTGHKTAIDCGSGIGRITKRLLLPMFDTVDLLEVNPKFLEEAKHFIGEESTRIGNYFCCGLQDFNPKSGHYDVIWCQWVLGHLLQNDLVTFFQRCRRGLGKNGLIIVKENVTKNLYDFDDTDSSYTRSRDQLVKIMEEAGLKIIKEEVQKNFPKEIYEVRIYALQ